MAVMYKPPSGTAFMDAYPLTHGRVMRKRICGGMPQRREIVANGQQVGQVAYLGRASAARCASTSTRQKQSSVWSLTMPMACMKA